MSPRAVLALQKCRSPPALGSSSSMTWSLGSRSRFPAARSWSSLSPSSGTFLRLRRAPSLGPWNEMHASRPHLVYKTCEKPHIRHRPKSAHRSPSQPGTLERSSERLRVPHAVRQSHRGVQGTLPAAESSTGVRVFLTLENLAIFIDIFQDKIKLAEVGGRPPSSPPS